VKHNKAGWIACVALSAGVFFSPSAAVAQFFGPQQSSQPPQQTPVPTQRTVTGTVFDAGDKPLIGVTVFLKNLKTKSIRSFTSAEKGHYYFAQVSKSDDFELWAEQDGRKSTVKTVSSWDSRTQFVSDLKIK
jgi:hypothetical protein